MSGSWSDDEWESDDDSSAGAGESMFGALDFSASVDPDEDVDPLSFRLALDHENDDSEAMYFTVTNPPGTVSVTALIDGRVMSIELEPQVTNMTETQLGEEILLIAQLASRNALAGQHVIAAGIMQRMGLDRLTTRSYLEHELHLPCAETVLADKAQIFAIRYAGDD